MIKEKRFSVIIAMCLIVSLVGIDLYSQPAEAQIIPSVVGVASSTTKVMTTVIMDLFLPIIFEIVNIIRKITVVTFSLFSFTEPFIKYIQSIIGLTIFEYFGEYGYLIYYGFIRIIILDIVLFGVYAFMGLINIIGIIPIVSIPISLITDYLVLFVFMPLIASMFTYFPDTNINPITQGINSIKVGLWGWFSGIVEIGLVILMIIYTIAMIIPIINIIVAVITSIVVGLAGVVVCIILPFVIIFLNIGHILPTILNYTPIVNLIKRIPSGTINLIEDLIYKTIDLISVLNI